MFDPNALCIFCFWNEVHCVVELSFPCWLAKRVEFIKLGCIFPWSYRPVHMNYLALSFGALLEPDLDLLPIAYFGGSGI